MFNNNLQTENSIHMKFFNSHIYSLFIIATLCLLALASNENSQSNNSDVAIVTFKSKSETCNISAVYLVMNSMATDKFGNKYNLAGHARTLLKPNESFEVGIPENVYKGIQFCCSCDNGNTFTKIENYQPFQLEKGSKYEFEFDCAKGQGVDIISNCN